MHTYCVAKYAMMPYILMPLVYSFETEYMLVVDEQSNVKE